MWRRMMSAVKRSETLLVKAYEHDSVAFFLIWYFASYNAVKFARSQAVFVCLSQIFVTLSTYSLVVINIQNFY